MAQSKKGQYSSDLRIVLVGKTGIGKSSAGNTILGKEAFHEDVSSKSVTKVCKKESNVVDGVNVKVVDTPGWCDTDLPEAQIVQEAVQCIDMSSPGPHVFLLVIQIGRFTEEEKQTVRKIQDLFGEGASKYMMVLFTRGDDLKSKTIDSYLKDANENLKDIVFRSCEGRYHVFNNREKNRRQVSELLEKIQDMVRRNGGGCFNSVTYQLLENYKKREAEMQERFQETETKLKLKIEELLKKEQSTQQEREQMRHTIRIPNVLEGTLVGMLERIAIAQQQKATWDEVNRQAEQQRRELHQQRIEEERQMLEMERTRMFRQHQEEIRRLENQIHQAEAERKDYLEKFVKKNSSCNIS